MLDFVSLEDPERKRARAEEHLKTLRREVKTFRARNPHTFAIASEEIDSEHSSYIFTVCGLKEPDPGWGLIVGDCIQNLRSALDHLAYQLATLANGGPLARSDEGRPMFPVYTDAASFKQHGEQRIAMLRPGDQARIFELQPFNGADASIWGTTPGIEPHHDPMHPEPIPAYLGVINRLNIIDKHRTLHPTWNWIDGGQPPPIPVPSRTQPGGALVGDAEVGRWEFHGPLPDLPADMSVDRYFPIEIAIGNPNFPMGAVDTILETCVGVVSAVLEIFRPCIESGAPPLPLRA